MIDIDTLIEPLRTPAVLGLSTFLCVATSVAALWLSFASAKAADDFFGPLISADPSLALPKSNLYFGFGAGGGPIHPRRSAYLKRRDYRTLADPELRLLGIRAHRVLQAQAVAVAALILCGLARMALAF